MRLRTRYITCAVLIVIFLSPWAVFAQGAASSMYNVKEIIVQYTRFTNPKSSEECGLTREDLAALLKRSLQGADGVPAIPSSEANPPMLGVARIDLVPEISSFHNEELDCTSWVSLTAQSLSNVTVPPVDVLRNVKIVYWNQGLLVTSNQSVHAKLIEDTLEKMARQFVKQYHIDQPPMLK
jgi:hypothetical protein